MVPDALGARPAEVDPGATSKDARTVSVPIDAPASAAAPCTHRRPTPSRARLVAALAGARLSGSYTRWR